MRSAPSGRKVYCPYSDGLVPLEETTPEHIVPLSLGGQNDFVLPVASKLNSDLGSAIDGKFSSDFFVARQRAIYGARGHSGVEPAVKMKNVRDKVSGRPLQMIWGKALRLWDPISGRDVALAGQQLEVKFQVDLDLAVRFVAKVFLAAGYFTYGELFRSAVRHEDLRLVMKGPRNLSAEQIQSVQTRLYARFQRPDQGEQLEEYGLQDGICQIICGSCVVFMPGPRNLGIFVGILGKYVGMLNVPADTSSWPRDGEHDLGHAIILSTKRTLRWSYRRLLARLLPEFERLYAKKSGLTRDT